MHALFHPVLQQIVTKTNSFPSHPKNHMISGWTRHLEIRPALFLVDLTDAGKATPGTTRCLSSAFLSFVHDHGALNLFGAVVHLAKRFQSIEPSLILISSL